MKKQMVIEFPEERMPEICSIKRKLQALEGVKIFMEPQQILYPGFFLDMLQRKVMVEEKEVLLTARELMSSQSWPGIRDVCIPMRRSVA